MTKNEIEEIAEKQSTKANAADTHSILAEIQALGLATGTEPMSEMRELMNSIKNKQDSSMYSVPKEIQSEEEKNEKLEKAAAKRERKARKKEEEMKRRGTRNANNN